MNDNYEWLNAKVRNFVMNFSYNPDTDAFDFKFLDEIRKMNKILLENIPSISYKEYKEKISLEKSIIYAKEFLNYIDPKYANYLDERINDGTIEFIDADKVEGQIKSNSTIDNGKRKIEIYYENNYGDVYCIIHEIIHDMNLILDSEDYFTRSLFTETLSFLATSIAKEYFMDKYPNKKEFSYNIYDEIISIYDKMMKMDFALNLIDLNLANGYIGKTDIANIFDDKSQIYISNVIYYLDEISNEETEITDMNIQFETNYLLACLLTFYIKNNYAKNEQIKVLKDLNEMIMHRKISDIYDYLDLDYIEKDDFVAKFTLVDEISEYLGYDVDINDIVFEDYTDKYAELNDESMEKLNQSFKEELTKLKQKNL